VVKVSAGKMRLDELNLTENDSSHEIATDTSYGSCDIYKIHNYDARNLDEIIKEEVVDVTITSPPYFDLKDYGHKDQIGYGQQYEEYLNDLKVVFSKVYSVTKSSGSLWVVIDSFKRDGQIVPLPFDFAAKLKEIGWKLQDIIIWRKDKTIPWTNGGSTRGIFEYVLFFSKSNQYQYFSDRVRNYQDLKKWWVKYPERYHPKGKNLDEVWEFPIPMQGSWGQGYIRHFCPLPEGLVDRIINLSTNESDVVFDPFSGSGTVPAQASFRNRKHIGFELNKEYIAMFDSYVEANIKSKRSEFTQSIHKLRESEAFEHLILNLRALKLAKVIKKELSNHEIKVKKIFVDHNLAKLVDNKKFSHVFFRLLVEKEISSEQVLKILETSPTVTKFRLELAIEALADEKLFYQLLPNDNLYLYSEQNTYKYKADVDKTSRLAGLILSQIEVDLNEKDYE
jgi:DNA modification methylase